MADPEPVEPPEAPEPLRLEVEAEPIEAEFAIELRAALLNHTVVRTRYPNADLWLVNLDVSPKDAVEGEGTNANVAFRAVMADLAGSDVVEAEGYRWALDAMAVIPTSRPRLPSEEEHAWAVGALKEGDASLAAQIDAGEVELYRPLPPLASVQDADGNVLRAVTVGLREAAADGTVRHRLLSVRSSDGEIVDHGELTGPDCGVADGPSCPAVQGEQQARIRVFRGDEVLWNLLVVRPSASSGASGSGVELRDVEYRRVRVFDRAHVPIVNVAYEDGDGAWAPTARTWLNEESCFEAEGEDSVPGFRTCTSAPRTILERGEGGGTFRGVALWLDGDELVVTSQVEAAWHRYVCEWRLHADGTIRPRLGFGAVRNPSTCHPHTHHAYWRFDFDVVGGQHNQVQEFNEPRLPGQLAPWHTIRYEVARRRSAGQQRQWRVRNVRTPHGYAIVPGPHDGMADDFGAGDFWVVRYHGHEVDDAEGFTTDPARVRAGLDAFVSGELVEREDVVVWYGVHVRQPDGLDGAAAPDRRVGPDLQPFMWKPPVEREAFEPLSPPPMPGPEDDDEDEDDDYEE